MCIRIVLLLLRFQVSFHSFPLRVTECSHLFYKIGNEKFVYEKKYLLFCFRIVDCNVEQMHVAEGRRISKRTFII